MIEKIAIIRNLRKKVSGYLFYDRKGNTKRNATKVLATKSLLFFLSHGNVFNFRGIVGIIRRLNIRK